MALSPKEIGFTEAEMATAQKLEEWIDRELLTYTPPGNLESVLEFYSSEFVDPHISDSIKRDTERLRIELRILPVVLEKFRQAGWLVEQRETDKNGYILVDGTCCVSFIPR